MNDKLENEALREIFDEISATDNADDFAENRQFDAFSSAAEEGFEDNFASNDLDRPLEGLFDYQEEEEIEEVGPNWASLFWGALLFASMSALAFTTYQAGSEQAAVAEVRSNGLEVESDIKDVSFYSLLAFNGNENAFERLRNLRANIDTNLSSLEGGSAIGTGLALPPKALNSLGSINSTWRELGPQIDLLAGNRSVVTSTLEQVKAVNDLTPQLLDQTDVLVNKLIENEASLKLINVGSRQRFLSQRIKASANEFAMGASGWQEAALLFEDDVKLFGEVNNDIRSMGGIEVAADLTTIDSAYKTLQSSAQSIIGNVADYEIIRNAVAQIGKSSQQLSEQVTIFSTQLDDRAEQPQWRQQLPWILAGVGLLGLIGLIWSLANHSRKREEVNNLRTKRAEDAVIKLLDEMGDLAQGDLTVEAQVTNEVTGAIADSVNFAISEMRVLVTGIKAASLEMTNNTEDSEQLIAQLLTSNDSQSEEILNAAHEIENMSNAMRGMSASALQSSERARVTADSAKKGASAVRDTITGMNTTRNQIQDTAKRLKRLGESSQQINEIVNLIQDVTEQTNVLSLNASIQAAMAGEAGRGFAVVAEEVQRLADRSARASSEITELVKNIQQDANSAISSMETTTQEVITGATMADEAGQALDEIEKISQNLFETIEKVASEATHESSVAQKVSERMNTLKEATEQGDLSVSQVAAALGQMRDVVDRLDKSVAGFRLPA